MKKAALHNLGCKVNSYETEAMQQLLEEAGYVIVPFHEEADVYIINTCSVTNIADRKSRQMLHRARKMNPRAVVVAAGCYVQAAAEELKKDKAVDLIIGNNRKTELVSILEEYFAVSQSSGSERKQEYLTDINHTREYEKLSIYKNSGQNYKQNHTRAFIKVQDGCNQFCSYCIIPYTRGRVRSRRPEDVAKEVENLVADGYREVVLTGIHLSSYGVDFAEEKKEDLLGLIIRLHKIGGLERIRLGSLEPRIITNEFAGTLSSMEKVCPHFHLSLQSGCNETLKRMNRRYTTEEYLEKCLILRDAFDSPAITTDVIVGFPGETEEEFEQTRKFLKQVHFYELHVFKYSKRAGTKAADMPDQLPEETKGRRSDLLLQLNKEMSLQFRQEFIGKNTRILLEEKVTLDGVDYMTGYTGEYIKAAVPFHKGEKGTFASGCLERFAADEILFLSE